MNVTLMNASGAVDISQLITSITISGEYRSCCRTADFGVINATIADIQTIAIELGDNIKIEQDGQVLFLGVVWEKSKSTDKSEIEIACKDYGIYLNKNKGSYSFGNLTPEDITAKICSDYGIRTGSIARTGVPVTHKFLGVTLYDMIMQCYTLANHKKYLCIFEGDKLSVLENGAVQSLSLKSGENILSTSVVESLNQMINQVRVYNKSDMLIHTAKNEADIQRYGVLGEYYKIAEEKENYQLKAAKMLQGIVRHIRVTNFGDAGIITGRSVVVTEPYTGLMGKFHIDQDQHNWKNGIYTNSLVLNFENLIDEKGE